MPRTIAHEFRQDGPPDGLSVRRRVSPEFVYGVAVPQRKHPATSYPPDTTAFSAAKHSAMICENSRVFVGAIHSAKPV
jgi:hypothetical protein